jgi:hypothetical protein
MIIKQWKQVLSGEKTQTRRLVREGEYTWIGGGYSNPDDSLMQLSYTEIRGANGRIRFQQGKTYPMIPRMMLPALYAWFDDTGWVSAADSLAAFTGGVEPRDPRLLIAPEISWFQYAKREYGSDWRWWLVRRGFVEKRIRIELMRRERLRDLSAADALAEGVVQVADGYIVPGLMTVPHDSPVAAYAAFWNQINLQRGKRWEDNPKVYVLHITAAT